MRRPARLRSVATLAALGLALSAAVPVRAFDLIGNTWPNGNVTMHLQLGTPTSPLLDGSTDWGSVAESALNDWNQYLGRVKFTVVRDSTATIARGNRTNNVAFRADIYGEAFDSRTLAVTLGSSSTATGAVTEKDVLFNSTRTWNSYRGSLRSGITEFRRVALHEFGHVLGLDHPDTASPFQNVSAIMNSTQSSVEALRPDDIAGVRSLYDTAPTQLLNAGDIFSLTVPVSGDGPFTYHWYFRAPNSPVAETFRLASSGTYTIGSVQTADAGTYVVTATSPAGVFFSNVAIVSPAALTLSADTTLANISTRGVVGSGNGVLIAGFVIGGAAEKTVLIRAAGPALNALGVGGTLSDPALSIVNASTQVVAQNDNWGSGDASALSAAFTRLGAFAFPPGSRDAAVLVKLPPGSYTAVVNGVGDANGIALVEVYDADPAGAANASRLVNIATRGQVNSGDDVLIAGLVVRGTGPRTYLIRAVGPTLARSPYNLTSALRDPFLQVYQGSTLLHENDDWDVPAAGQPALRTAAQQVGAFALQETRSNSGLDAVMLMTLQPGSYTAKVTGFQNATGVALIEIYEMP